MAHLIFITGGVVSSLGKGVASASLGALWQAAGYRVTFLKFDPYINLDPGTMSPYEHGEVFVTDDGAQTDLDLGHYERFAGVRLGRKNNYTTGQIYAYVIRCERSGGYAGGTVQVIPHITDRIKQCIYDVEEDFDIVFVEVGGTVGDIEGLPFYEAIRQLRVERPKHSTLSIHLTWLPYIPSSGELKTKPTQHSVKELRSIGIQADMLFCRMPQKNTAIDIKKIALFTNIPSECVYILPDVHCLYEVITTLHDQRVLQSMMQCLGRKDTSCDISFWQELINRHYHPKASVRIALVGKYIGVKDAYRSLDAALYHSSLKYGVKADIEYVDADSVLENSMLLHDFDAVIIAGGFGDRGVDGKICAARWCMDNHKPFIGICLGMQAALIAYARSRCGLDNAHSVEMDASTPYPIIVRLDTILSSEKNQTPEHEDLGGSLRLGLQDVDVVLHSKAHSIYGNTLVRERHRHRYVFNNAYKMLFEEHGMIFSGSSYQGILAEIIELPDHPFFIACQYHPEFLSTPRYSHPLFDGLFDHMVKAKNIEL